MIDLAEYQKLILQNKVNKGFNTSSIQFELLLAYTEMAEVFDAHNKGLDTFGEELADVAIYLLGMAEMKGINLEEEIKRKVAVNEKRVYPKA